MGESISTGGRARLFWQVSALALIAVGAGAGGKKAEAAPTTTGEWTLDLQGQWALASDGASNGPVSQDPNFENKVAPSGGYNLSGEITYQPAGSPWSFGVGVRYGRMNKHSKNHSFATTNSYTYPSGKYTVSHATAQTLGSSISSQHYTIDFEVGHDFGVGLFGPGVTTVGIGVRYAHFNSTVTGNFATNAKYTVQYLGDTVYTSFSAKVGRFTSRRTTDVVGPRIFVKTVSPITADSPFSISAGAGIAMLYGRQTVHTTLDLSSGTYAPAGLNRANSRGVPNADGFLQLNWSPAHSGFSVGVGYKIDAYFTVMDGGFTGKKEIDNIEHGPYLDITLKIP